jgi:UDP-2,3-diacylglucosamine pyrophosphatase LpxH
MIIVISDLHFVDGTAGEHNTTLGAYRLLIDQAAYIFKNTRAKAASMGLGGRPPVELIFNGDIFDLLRTQAWFGEELRPYGYTLTLPEEFNATVTADLERKCAAILDAILAHPEVATIGEFFRDRKALRRAFGGVPLRKSFIPGNHDRLINLFPSLRRKVIEFLDLGDGEGGAPDPSEPFPNFRIVPDYGAFICHGHEYDPLSFTGGRERTFEVYRPPSISDAVVIDLVTRVPYEAARIYQEQVCTGRHLPPADRFLVKLQEIDNVRPFSAVVSWMAQLFEEVKECIDLGEVMARSLHVFREYVFVKRWLSGEGMGWWSSLEYRTVQRILKGLELIGVGQIGKAMNHIQRYFRDYEQVASRQGAFHEPALRQDPRLRYVVAGHIHQAGVHPLTGPRGTLDLAREVTYLNTGTFRPVHSLSTFGHGFSSVDRWSFVVLHCRGEQTGIEGPSFRLWNAARSRK